MCKAEDRIKQETERVRQYLHSSTEDKLLRVCRGLESASAPVSLPRVRG